LKRSPFRVEANTNQPTPPRRGSGSVRVYKVMGSESQTESAGGPLRRKLRGGRTSGPQVAPPGSVRSRRPLPGPPLGTVAGSPAVSASPSSEVGGSLPPRAPRPHSWVGGHFHGAPARSCGVSVQQAAGGPGSGSGVHVTGVGPAASLRRTPSGSQSLVFWGSVLPRA
jgi:hypothetical protein